MQVRNEPDCDCGSCQRYTECIGLLRNYPTIPVSCEKTADPTMIAEEPFVHVKVME